MTLAFQRSLLGAAAWSSLAVPHIHTDAFTPVTCRSARPVSVRRSRNTACSMQWNDQNEYGWNRGVDRDDGLYSR